MTHRPIGADDTTGELPGVVEDRIHDWIDTGDALAIPLTQKGAPGGVAPLDGGTKIPVAYLPSSVFIYKGVWNAATNTPTLSDGSGVPGWYYRVGTAGTQNLGSGPITFDVGDAAIYNDTGVWEKSDGTDAVLSVAGLTGIVTAAALKTALNLPADTVVELASLDTRLDSAEGTIATLPATYALIETTDDLQDQLDSLAGLTVSDITFPTVMGHRGAGGAAAPDGTKYAFDMACSYPANVIGDGGDWRDDVFGGSVICHDPTIDALTSGTGNVSTLSPSQVRSAVIDCSTWFGTMFPDTKFLGSEMLSIYGGIRVLAPEPKTVGQAAKVAALIAARHLERSVIPNSFDPTWLAPFAAIGCPQLALNVGDHMPTPTELNTWAAAGINWLWLGLAPTATYTFTDANIATLKADGRFRLGVWSLYRTSELSVFNGTSLASFDLFISEDPIYQLHALGAVISGGHPLASFASRESLSRQGDPFMNPGYYPGQFGSLNTGIDTRPLSRGKFFDNRWGIHDPTPAVLTVLAPWLTPPARTTETKLTVKWWQIFDALGSDTARFGKIIYQPTDVRYQDAASVTESGPMVYLRANGTLVAGGKVSGVSNTSSSTSPVAVSAPVTLNQTLAAATSYVAASITVTAIPSNLASGMSLALPEQKFITLTASATAGATSITGTIKDAAGVNAQLTTAITAGKAMPQAVPLTAEFQTSGTPSVKITRTDNAQTVTNTGANGCSVANLKYPSIERQDNTGGGSTGLQVSFIAVSTVWS